MKWLARLAITFTVWLAVAVTMATVLFILLCVVAGPHSGVLLRPLEVAVWIAGYAVIIVVPLFAAVIVYRRLGPPVATDPQRDSA